MNQIFCWEHLAEFRRSLFNTKFSSNYLVLVKVRTIYFIIIWFLNEPCLEGEKSPECKPRKEQTSWWML
jgi:hypothetical protein